MKAFESFHPFVLFFYFVGTLMITMLTVNPVLLALSFAGAVLFAVMLENFRTVAVSMVFYLPMYLLVAVSNPLFSHNGVTPLFFMNDNPVTLEAVLYGAAVAGMILSVLYWCRCYSQVVTSDKFLYLFGRFAPRVSLVLSMALRFVPLFTAQAKKIHNIQKTLGLYAVESRVDKLRGVLRVFSCLLTWSLENAVDTAASMRARGYGLPARSSYSIFRFTVRDGAALAVLTLMFAFTIANLRTEALAFSYYPRITTLSLSPQSLLCYIGALGAMCVPFLLEVKETFLWNCLKSKI